MEENKIKEEEVQADEATAAAEESTDSKDTPKEKKADNSCWQIHKHI